MARPEIQGQPQIFLKEVYSDKTSKKKLKKNKGDFRLKMKL